MVVLLLAITCANVASLLVARAATRQREIAIRISIGAGRGRLVRQLLTESLLLSVLGAGLGLLVTHWGIGIARGVTVANGIDIDLDWRVAAFTLIVALACGVGFGLLPALRGTRVRLASTLTSHARGDAGDAAGRTTTRVLVAGQIALSLFLLVIAALFARSLQELHRVDVGFDRDRLIVARIDPRVGGYAAAELPDLHRRLIERIEAMPGVTSASLSSNPPFSGARVRSGFEVEGYVRRGDEQLSTQEEQVTIGYFQTVGLRLLQGRTFGPEDTTRTRRVSVISATMARRLFPSQDAVGKRWGGSTNFDVDAFEIVGVVEDARYGDLKHAPPNMVYLLAAQSDQYLNGIEVRVAGQPAALVKALRAALTETEPRLPVTFIRTLDEQVRGTIGADRLLTVLTLTFSGVALFLACLGLYGTVSYGVSRRRSELGLRMALGARRSSVEWLVMREALWLVGVGLLVGLPLSSVAVRMMRQLVLRDHGVRWSRARERGADPAGHRRPGGVHPGAPRVTARSDARAQGGTMRRQTRGRRKNAQRDPISPARDRASQRRESADQLAGVVAISGIISNSIAAIASVPGYGTRSAAKPIQQRPPTTRAESACARV